MSSISRTTYVEQIDLERMDAVAIRQRTYHSIAPLIQPNLFQRLVARELLDMQIVVNSLKSEQEHAKTMDNIRKIELEEAQSATKKLRDHAAQVDALRQAEIRQLTEQVQRVAVHPRHPDDVYSHTPVHGNIPPPVTRPQVPTNVHTPTAQPFGRGRGSYQSFDDASVPLSQQPMSQRRYNAELNDSERRRMEQHYAETRGTYRAMQEGATYIAPPIKRESFPTKHTWNGLPETWDSFVQLFEGHWTNQSMDYFLDQEFRTAYTPGLNAYASISHILPLDPYTQKPTVNERQFGSDSKVIFGGLKTALRVASGYSHFLLTHQHDGFSAWFTLCSMSQEGTNIHTTANHYRILLAEKYNPAKHSSLVQFVTYKASLFAKLDDLRARHPDSSISVFSDPDKMGQIIDSLGSDVSGNYFQFLDSSMRQGTSFPVFLETLRRLLTYEHHRDAGVGRRRAHQAVVDPVPQPAPTHITALAAQRAYDPFYITSEALDIIKTFDPQFLQRYRQARSLARPSVSSDERRDSNQAPQTNANVAPVSNQLPRQYNAQQPDARAANHVDTNEDSSEEAIDVFTSEMNAELGQTTMSYLDNLSNTFNTRSINMTNTVVKAHVEYCHVNLLRTDGQFITVSDSGADSWVIGKGWKVLDYLNKTVDLVGFDKKYAKKMNLPVVHAAATIKTQDGELFLGIVHNAVHNETCTTTLLSESQTRNLTGNVVDSVAKKHLDWYGKHGHQAIRLIYSDSDDDCLNHRPKPVIIDLRMNNALMTFQHRLPTEEEMDTLPRYYFTSPIMWEPHAENDESQYIDPLTSNEALLHRASIIDRTFTNAQAYIHSTTQPPQSDDQSISVLSCTSLRDKVVSIMETHRPDPDGWLHVSMIKPCSYVALPDHVDTVITAPSQPIDPSAVNDYQYIGTCFHTQSDHLIHEEWDDMLFAPSPRIAYAIRTFTKLQDAEKLQPYLGYRPLEVIRQTLENTTQLASVPNWENMRRHRMSLYPFMNRTHLNETVATDTFFSSVPGIGGTTCAQVFYGLVSHYINIFPMRTESNALQALQDFMRYEGLPLTIRSDNSRTQRYNRAWVELLRTYLIPAEFSEPHNQQQNPVEMRAIKWLKENIQVIQRRTGAPMQVWGYIAKYVADIHNITADETLGWKTPHFVRKGAMPDISPYIQFTFYEEVYYLDTQEKFPNSKELKGWWIGVAHHVGDHMCFEILNENEQVIERSVVRSAITHPNKFKDRKDSPPPLSPEAIPVVDSPMSPELVTFSDPVSSPLVVSNLDKYDERSTQQYDLVVHDDIPLGPNIDSHDLYAPVDDINSTSESIQQIQLHEIADFLETTSLIPSYDDTSDKNLVDMDDKQALIKEGLKPALQDPPVRVTRSGRNVKKPGRFIINNAITENATHACLNAIQDQCSTTMRLFPTIATIPNNGPTDLLKVLLDRQRIRNQINDNDGSDATNEHTSEFISRYLQMLRKDAADPEESFSSPTDDINYSQLAYLQECDKAVDEHDNVWQPLCVEKHFIRKKGNGTKQMFVKVVWQTGTSSWQLMNALRYQDPVIIVQYVLRNEKLKKHKWFKWIKHYLDDDDNINESVYALAARTDNKNAKRIKFGVEVPRSIRHAIQLDMQNNNNEWREAIEKELKQINDFKTFRRVTKDDSIQEYLRIPYHFVFDVKFDGRKKARLVAGGNVTETPKDDIYSGVVSIEMIRIGFLLAELNELTVCTADISNAFLYGKTREKVYIKAGDEFGPDANQDLIIDKGLYGLKSSSARFHEHLSDKCKRMGFRPTTVDSDFWMKDCGTHYEYLARYVDDLLVFSKDPMAVMEELKLDYSLKSVGVPEYFLGGNVEELDPSWHKDGIKTALSASTYAANIVEKFERIFNTEFRKQRTPMHEEYHPETDESSLLDQEEISLYRGLIGSANWLVTLGRFDIAYAVSSLARYSLAPRRGHLEAMKRIFGYIKDHKNGRILIDPSKHQVPIEEENPDADWIEFYPDACEEIPPTFPEPKGASVQITVYKDADHAFDLVTRRSVTGILLFLNNTPITWISKRQKTVETSTYGSELVAGRIATDLIVQYRYMMRMLGVPLDGAATLCGDNRSVMINTTVPSSQLKKKHNAIAYHRIREALAAGIMRFVKIRTEDNVADLLTKPLKNPLFHSIVSKVLFRKVDWNNKVTNCEQQVDEE